jgi:hypothetical protein
MVNNKGNTLDERLAPLVVPATGTTRGIVCRKNPLFSYLDRADFLKSIAVSNEKQLFGIIKKV